MLYLPRPLVCACALLLPTLAAAQGSGAMTTLGSVRIDASVLADGKPLAPGTYELRLTGEHPDPLPGQSADAQRYVEIVKDGQVVAREIAEVFRADERPVGTSGTAAIKAQMLKGGEYLRLSTSHAGARYLVHLPVAP
jgi:hypothetical protein